MSAFDNNDFELTEEEAEQSQQEEVEQSEEDSDEETYIESLTRQVAEENADSISAYVVDPESPDEVLTNEAIKKFLVIEVRKRLLESFEDQLQWIEDADLAAMIKKWKKVTSKEDVDSSTAMKRIIKENINIAEVVEQHLEEMAEASENDEEGNETA